MKKTLLHTIIATFAVVLSFSSCLGDSSNSYESGNSLVYIGAASESSAYQQYGVARELGSMFTSDYIKSLNTDRVYRMAFKVKLGNSGVLPADYTNPIGDGLPLSRGQASSYLPTGGTVNLPPQGGEMIYPTKLGVTYFMPFDTDANDIWAFGFNCEGYDDDFLKDDSGDYRNIDFYAYIEEKNQNLTVEGGSKPLADNQAIVNLYMVRRDAATPPNAKKKTQTGKEFTINMAQLRSYFERRVTHETETYYTPVAIQFRYTTEDSNGKKEEISLGRLDISQSVDYYMVIDNPNKPS